MNNSNLFDFIYFIEHGTNIHISVVFLENNGNEKTALPNKHLIHSRPFCTYAKTTHGFSGCFKCKNLALKKAIQTKKAFSGVCVNGIYEYCHPIVDNGNVIGIIFIGNIMPPPEKSDRLQRFTTDKELLKTLESSFHYEDLSRLGSLLENYILYLIYEFPSNENFDPVIQNIKGYIEENLTFNISSAHISRTFNYSEKYLGRLFKKKTGSTLKEYINHRRLRYAQKMLVASDMPITEISTKSGYNNVSYFNRIFKSEFSMSPSEYRKEQKQVSIGK